MTRTGSSSQLGELRRYSKGLRSSSKKSAVYSDYYEEESRKESTGNLANNRSISLGALHQGSSPLEPRMAQLETLEAKMASIEVSLSTTPRRKKPSSTASTPVPPPVHGLFGTRAASEQEENRVEALCQGLKGNLWNRGLRQGGNGSLTDRERKTAQERLGRLKSDLDSKRLTIKNIKIALDTIDISDNIDVRIQQAELEYQLGREELNLLSIMEESRNLQVLLEENNVQQQTIFSYIGNSTVSLHGIELMYDPKSPQFGVNHREEGGVLVEWASETSGLVKGDRLLEVNGKLVTRAEEVGRLLVVAPSPAQVVVMRKQRADQLMSHLQAELSVVKEKAGEAERTRDSFRRDNLRLTHRISYLEEQVAELLERARESKPKAVPQVFQKGNQVALVANLPGLEKTENNLPQAKARSHHEEARSAKSVDVIEKPKRKKDLPSARSTHSLDVECSRQRHSDHLSGEPRQRHIREARSSLFNFLDRTKYDFDSEPNLDCSSESSLRHKKDKVRPVPPKKPIRLSLTRATSLQSVENSEKKSLKRTHKGEAPPVPPLINGHSKGVAKNYSILINGHKDNHTTSQTNGQINVQIKNQNGHANTINGSHSHNHNHKHNHSHTIHLTQSESKWC
ncbi:uncharacterized protein sprt isoform X2 [Halyomorpha halys]|uniref:uncharacterized protein sprt isoform X2 n=1 Tax=Halyomorpha halys TaxID=286706 RepID=UPI0006D4F11E|nr:uncharacterized protein LOC106685531 isoform X2 [Halyomorpha halys]